MVVVSTRYTERSKNDWQNLLGADCDGRQKARSAQEHVFDRRYLARHHRISLPAGYVRSRCANANQAHLGES